MQLLTKQTDYAVRALLNLAGDPDNFKTADAISVEEKIPYPFLRRILQKLRQESLITAKEGKTGGVRILKNPEKITLNEIIELFQGSIELSSCMFRKRICSNRRTCILRKRIKSIEKKVISEFDDITIAGLMGESLQKE